MTTRYAHVQWCGTPDGKAHEVVEIHHDGGASFLDDADIIDFDPATVESNPDDPPGTIRQEDVRAVVRDGNDAPRC